MEKYLDINKQENILQQINIKVTYSRDFHLVDISEALYFDNYFV